MVRVLFRALLASTGIALFLAGAANQVTVPAYEAADQETAFEVREYAADNGEKVQISSTGTVVAAGKPKRANRKMIPKATWGYELIYRTGKGPKRKLFDFHDRFSRTIKGRLRDLVPVSFEGPAPGSFKSGERVSATVVLETRDKALRLTHRFNWTAGSDRIEINTTIASASASQTSIVDRFGWRCACIPPPPPPPFQPIHGLVTSQKPLTSEGVLNMGAP